MHFLTSAVAVLQKGVLLSGSHKLDSIAGAVWVSSDLDGLQVLERNMRKRYVAMRKLYSWSLAGFVSNSLFLSSLLRFLDALAQLEALHDLLALRLASRPYRMIAK